MACVSFSYVHTQPRVRHCFCGCVLHVVGHYVKHGSALASVFSCALAAATLLQAWCQHRNQAQRIQSKMPTLTACTHTASCPCSLLKRLLCLFIMQQFWSNHEPAKLVPAVNSSWWLLIHGTYMHDINLFVVVLLWPG